MPEFKTRRPWWLAALATGVGIGIGAVGALGLAGTQARGEPRVTTSGVSVQVDAEWRAEVTRTLTDMRERLARIEGRLERR